MLCIDLDRFKSVNDTFGHAAGDAALKRMSEVFRQCLRENDVASRFGGDEFAVLLGALERPKDAVSVAERIARKMSEPLEFDGQTLLIGASLGIAIAPLDGCDCERLMKNADVALYWAKSEGRGGYHCYEKGLDAALYDRRKVKAALRRSLLRA
jgi:diguanylate cyclase (GGDEF)-like protein